MWSTVCHETGEQKRWSGGVRVYAIYGVMGASLLSFVENCVEYSMS